MKHTSMNHRKRRRSTATGTTFRSFNNNAPMRTPSLCFALAIIAMVAPTATDARLLLPSNTVLLSYSTMMGLAAQSSRWKHAMEEDLAKLAKSTAEAAAWQEAAGSDQVASEALTETSVAEQADGALLESEGEALITKGTADQAKAVAAEEEADGLVEVAAEAHGESVAMVAEAASEEALAEEDVAKATSDAALAAENTATAEADEAGTAICQFIPLIDVVCDVVGGVAAVGLETSSVRSAAMAAEEYAAAAVLQAKVESATTEATELEASAVEEGEEAGVLKSKAAALEIQADEELAEGEADEAAATEALDKSVLDKEAAEEEQAKAATEEEESTNAWSQSVHHGANACGKAIMLSLASGIALVFWILRIAGSVVAPVMKSGVGFLWTSLVMSSPEEANLKTTTISSISSRSATTEILHTASHILQHGLFLVAFFGVWGDALLQLRNLSAIPATGGIVLGFSFSLAATQSFIMHAAPKAFQHGGSFGSSVWVAFREFSRGVIVLSPLVVMEILLVWVNLGSWVFVPSMVQGARRWWLWLVLALGIVVHHVYFTFTPSRSTEMDDQQRRNDEARSLLIPTSEEKDGFTDYGTRDVDADTDTEFFDAEEDEWISIEAGEDTFHMALSTPQDEIVFESGDKWFYTLVLEDASRIRLVLVFEFLMASIMLALLRQSTPALQELWPASKTILMAANPHWHLLVAVSGVAALVVLICACL